jgi:hypothetical protein
MKTLRLGDTEIIVARYMNVLHQDVIDSFDATDTRIVASGVHPDGTVVLLTNKAEVFEFDSQSYHIPPGDFLPLDEGRSIFLPNVNNRWPGPSEGFEVSSEWLIEKSVSSLSSAGIHVGDTYLGEIDIEAAETSDT